jgi:lipoate-protein ligase A
MTTADADNVRALPRRSGGGVVTVNAGDLNMLLILARHYVPDDEWATLGDADIRLQEAVDEAG